MKRYNHQIALPEFGSTGQQMLSEASVLVVGAGGLGVVVVSYLASMGVGCIGICDFDRIEESNLHRQFHYTPDDIGLLKASVLAEKARKQNPSILVEGYTCAVDESNINSIVGKYQIVCDCTDRARSRILMGDYSNKHSLPLVHGAVSDWQGYVTVFNHKLNFRLADLFEFEDYFNSQTCSVVGVSSTVCGLVGSYMANETIKIIIDSGNVLEGEILYMNSLKNLFTKVKIKKNRSGLVLRPIPYLSQKNT